MTNLTPTSYLTSLEASQQRVGDAELIDKLMAKLTNRGFCSARQSEAWRILTRPECPLQVQLEFGAHNEAVVDIVPLSVYTDTFGIDFPLADKGIPHTERFSLSDPEDIDHVVASIERCFPR